MSRPLATAAHPPSPGADTGTKVPLRSGVLRLDELMLEAGGRVERARIGFNLYGDPSRPVVVVLGGISSGRAIREPEGASRPGWWQEFVGPALAVDTDRFCVLGVDYLGGFGASSRPAGPGFPPIHTPDQARAIAAVLDHLGVRRAHAVVGASYGGMVALALAARHPTRLSRLVVISAAHESHPMATALRTLQRRTVRLGLATGRVEEGLAIARGIAMTGYRTIEEFATRFPTAPSPAAEGGRFPVEAYLEHQGTSFARRFSPWSFLCLSESIDLHRVEPGQIPVPTTLIAVEQDSLVPTWQMRALAARLGAPCGLVEIPSIYGHDAFLKEVPAVSDIVHTALIREE